MEVYKIYNAVTVIEFIIKPKLSNIIIRIVVNKDALKSKGIIHYCILFDYSLWCASKYIYICIDFMSILKQAFLWMQAFYGTPTLRVNAFNTECSLPLYVYCIINCSERVMNFMNIVFLQPFSCIKYLNTVPILI